jgi:hypothetical protein
MSRKNDPVEALRKIREQREELDQREAKLREEAATSLGRILLDCGAETIDPGQLKRLLRAVHELGMETALERLSAAR